MADAKISDLTTGVFTSADYVPVSRSGANRKVNIGQWFREATATNGGDAKTVKLTADTTWTPTIGGINANVAHGALTYGYSDFTGQAYPDPVVCVGYNVAVGGRESSSEISVGMFFEADYYLVDAAVPSGRHSEAYIATRGGSTDSHNRPLFFQWDRVLGTLISSQVHAAGANGATGFKVFRPTGSAGEQGSLLHTFNRNGITVECDDTTANTVLNLKGGSTNRTGQVTLGYGATSNALTLQSRSAQTSTIDLNSSGSSVYFYAVPGGVTAASAMGLGYTGGSGDALSNSQILAVDCASGAGATIGGILIRGRGTSMTGLPLSVTNSAGAVKFRVANGTTHDAYNVVIGSAALATSATDGFLYIPTCAGTPTGNSTDYAGMLPIVYDTTGDKLWINTSGTTWKGVVLA